MRLRRHVPSTQRGVALVLTLVLLLGLSGFVAAYLAISTLEPQISRNLADGSNARNLAEAGIERGFNVLAATVEAGRGWSDLLAGATAAHPWVALAGLANTPIGGATTRGTVSVTIRNYNGAADTASTGLSATTRPASVLLSCFEIAFSSSMTEATAVLKLRRRPMSSVTFSSV